MMSKILQETSEHINRRFISHSRDQTRIARFMQGRLDTIINSEPSYYRIHFYAFIEMNRLDYLCKYIEKSIINGETYLTVKPLLLISYTLLSERELLHAKHYFEETLKENLDFGDLRNKIMDLKCTYLKALQSDTFMADYVKHSIQQIIEDL